MNNNNNTVLVREDDAMVVNNVIQRTFYNRRYAAVYSYPPAALLLSTFPARVEFPPTGRSRLSVVLVAHFERKNTLTSVVVQLVFIRSTPTERDNIQYYVFSRRSRWWHNVVSLWIIIGFYRPPHKILL